MWEAGQLCRRGGLSLQKTTLSPGCFCQKLDTSFSAGRAVISHSSEALAHHSSNNKVDFLFVFSSLSKTGRKKNAGGEFNPRVGICGCLDIYMALAVAACVLRVTSCPRGL